MGRAACVYMWAVGVDARSLSVVRSTLKCVICLCNGEGDAVSLRFVVCTVQRTSKLVSNICTPAT